MFCSLKERSRRDGFMVFLGHIVGSDLIDNSEIIDDRPLHLVRQCWKARHVFPRLCDCHTSQSISDLWNPKKNPCSFLYFAKILPSKRFPAHLADVLFEKMVQNTQLLTGKLLVATLLQDPRTAEKLTKSAEETFKEGPSAIPFGFELILTMHRVLSGVL